MSDFSSLGKSLALVGLMLLVLGAVFFFVGKVPFLGKLPGDIRVEKDRFSFYFPLATCLLVSAFLSAIFWLFSKFK